MYRQTVYCFFLALILIEAAFLLGHLHLKEYGNRPKVSFWGAPVYSLSSFFPAGMPVYEPSPEAAGVNFPSSVGGLAAGKLIDGEEALEYARKIHGEDASIQRVFIAHYSNKHEQVVLWFCEFSSSAEAGRHMEKINSRIKNSRTFKESGLFYLQNVEIYYAHGLEQSNYFYNKRKTIYWITLSNADPLPLFLQFYQYF